MPLVKTPQPYFNDYPEANESFRLACETVRPALIVAAHRVHDAHTVLSAGTARLDPGADLLFDLGDEYVGRLEFELTCAEAGVCSAIYGESVEECRADDTFDIGWYRRPTDRWSNGGGSSHASSAGRRACRYIRISVPSNGASVSVGNVRFVSYHYPVQDHGTFSSSSVRLNRIWDICSRTTLLCMQQFYEDGPKRDGLLWLGDARVQMHCNYYAFGDAALARKSLFVFASTQTADGWIPANAMSGAGHHHPMDYMPEFPEEALGSWRLLHYCADYAPMVLEYLMHTGDDDAVARLWPSVVRQLDYLVAAVDPPNLAVRLQKDLMTDTDYVRSRRWASEGTFLLQLHASYRAGERLASLLGDKTAAHAAIGRWRAQANACEQAVRTRYWSDRLGLFVDYPTREPEFERPSWHVNAYAAALGILPDGTTADTLLTRTADFADRRWIPRGTDGPPEYFIADALVGAGLITQAFTEVDSYWGAMLDWGATTCWEAFDPDAVRTHPGADRPMSLCHGWSAGANILLAARVAGLTPVSPGYSRCRLSPTMGDLGWVDLRIPVPTGEILVSLEASGAEIRGRVEVPDGTALEYTDGRGDAAELTAGVHDIALSANHAPRGAAPK
jgi:hypothetical protein